MNNIKHDTKHQISERLATIIASGILQVQYWFAKILQSSTKKWKQPQRLIFLYMTCLVFGGMSMVVILQSLNSGEVSEISHMKFTNKMQAFTPQHKGFLITKEELQKVQKYKLEHPKLDKEMPGLYDSLNLIEQSYYSQQK